MSSSESKSDEPRFTLGYWKIRGLAAPARLIFAYKNVKYNNVDYEYNADNNTQQWPAVKYKLGFDFPNLPYLIDNSNGLHLTESRAIYRYLARTFNIGNNKDPLQAYDEMVGDIVSDLGSKFSGLSYNPKFLELKAAFLAETLPLALEPLEVWLSGDNKYNKNNKSKKWLGGDVLCYADFQFWEILDRLIKLESTVLEKFPSLSKYYANFKEIDTIKHYLENDLKARYLINGASAQFK